MKLKDTGLTAEELKDIVKKYMVETYARYDFIAERAEGMYLYDEKGVAYLDFYGGVAVNTPGNSLMTSCIHSITHTQFHRHFSQRRSVTQSEWIRFSSRTQEQKPTNV